MTRLSHSGGRGSQAAGRPVLVLASPADAVAIEMATRLKQDGQALRIEVRTPEELILAPRWEHRVESDRASNAITLHDGTAILVPSVIFNRLPQTSWSILPHGKPVDREYANSEMSALLLSWLRSLPCQIVNAPSSTGLNGPAMHMLAWHRLAAEVGLAPVSAYATTSTRRFPVPPGAELAPALAGAPGRVSPTRRVDSFGWYLKAPGAGVPLQVEVVGGRSIGDAPPEVLSACAALAKKAGVDVLQLDLLATDRAPPGAVLVGADTCPPALGTSALDALVDLLRRLALHHEAGAEA